MRTPIADFIADYGKSGVRLHMPGHKGTVIPDDITEIDGADVLYSPSGIIEESEKYASEIFGSKKTVYSVEGSSLSIRATVYLIKAYSAYIGKNPVILAARNVHSTFVSACAFCDVDPIWLYGNGSSILTYRFSPEELDSALVDSGAVAFYLTSPDYLGNTADLEAISAVCRKHGVLLVVDNAHGAYLKFLSPSRHPLDYGADICIDSAHKTLPCLTGTGYLHFGKNVPEFFILNANKAMALFASTSPSYLLLRSLDLFNAAADEFRQSLVKSVERVRELKETLALSGYTLIGDEPQKITVKAKDYGYYGYELSEILKNNAIYAEFYDKDYLTLMFSPSNAPSDFIKTGSTLSAITPRPRITEEAPSVVYGKRAVNIRNAVFAPSEEVSVESAVGRVYADLTCSCPPAVPIAICGELITEDTARALAYYGKRTVSVLK